MGEHLPTVICLGWEDYYAKSDSLVSLTLLGRYPVKVQDFWVPAVEAMEHQLIATGYENPCDWIGSYKVRNIFGSIYISWHSYGGAIDLDYGGDVDGDGDPTIDKNPHLHRRLYPGDPAFGVEFQLLEHQVHAIEAIRTVNGKRVWRWLGWSIGDTMHFEPNCSPDDIATGIDPKSLIGAEMTCPWTVMAVDTTETVDGNEGVPWRTRYAPCDDHWDNGNDIEWGVNTGACSVPSWGENGMLYGIDTNRINLADNNRDDFTTVLTYGRWLTMEDRAKGAS